MFSALSKIPTIYLCVAILALISGGHALDAMRPHIRILSAGNGQIAFGLGQICLGLAIVVLTFVVCQKVRF